MNSITVIQINQQFYVPISTGLREIPFAIVSAWQKEGADVQIKRGEDYV
jgi:hypothetical protein